MSWARSAFTHQRAWRAARWAAAIVILVVLVVGLDGREIVARIQAANVPLVIGGVLGLVAVHLLGAAAWRTLCRQLGGLRLGWGAGLRVYYAAQALGGVTPANLGGDAYRVLVVRNAGLGWSAAVAPVLVQRATSYLALALLALPALGWLAASGRIPVTILLAGLVLSGLAGGVALLLLAAPARWVRLRARLPWGPAPSDSAPTDPDATLRASLRSVAGATGLGLAFHGVSVLLTGLLAVAVDPSATGISMLAAVVVARLSLAVPVLPSGIGANEAILSLLFAGLGMAPQTALAALLLSRAALVLTTLLGTGLLLGGRNDQAVAPAASSQLPAASTR